MFPHVDRDEDRHVPCRPRFLAEAPVDLSSDGRQMVLRLGRRDRAGHGRNVEFTAVRRMFMDATAIGALR
ncbi:hypothetical protein [Burkholderia ambifaria]|jgi:hypothetical protein|uniref:hypothetical protein n=1 Tax=Burkholderia ambifaria TaxID=152480 RepID=UPI0015884CFC|nr:hypothetical protein [Burkholderia ambifaria]